MSNGDAVAANNYFLDDQPDDALTLEHVRVLHLSSQSFEERAQRMSEPKVGCLVGKLGAQGFEFGVHLRLTPP